MPWKETNVLEERARFVVEVVQRKDSMTALCERYAVSRKTGYKWLARYREHGCLAGLVDESRRPKRSPGKTPRVIEDRVVALREQHGWGSRKLKRLLVGRKIQLGRTAIDRILRERGLVKEPSQSRPAVTRFEREQPNELVQMDFKGQYPLANGGWCYPLSQLDDHSRYALSLAALPSQNTAEVQPAVEASLVRFGVPEAILVDHGTPWWSSTNGHGLTRFSVFLIRQGIHLIYSGIAHPQTQGKVERFHRTLNEWFKHHGMPATLRGFGEAFEELRCEYNQVRPHEALGLDTPAQHYRPSARTYDPNPREWEYPPGATVHRLSDNGCLYLSGRYCFVCHALAGEHVRCEIFDDHMLVSYRHMAIREIDLATGASRTILEPYGPTGH